MKIKICLILVTIHNPVFGPIYKKVIGKMKNEFRGKIICEFVGLKSKMYSLVDVDGEENEKQKESIRAFLGS